MLVKLIEEITHQGYGIAFEHIEILYSKFISGPILSVKGMTSGIRDTVMISLLTVGFNIIIYQTS
jgi:hypothetical protein